MVRFYLAPKIGTGTGDDAFRPSVIADLRVRWEGIDYGRYEPVMLAGADVTAAQHALITGQAGFTSIPVTLDSAIGGAVATVQAALENLRLPGDFVQSTQSYRDVIRITSKAQRFFQRFGNRQLRTVLESGVTLATTFSELTPAQRTALAETADDLRINTNGVTGSTTMRQAFRLIGLQLDPTMLMGETF